MESRDITNNYANETKHVYPNVADEISAPPAQAGQKQVQNSPSPKGDTVTISSEARDVAAQSAKTSPAPVPVPPSYTRVKQTITSDGTQVLIEGGYIKDAEGKRQLTDARVTFTSKDGTSVSHTVTDSTVFTQDENGQWQMHGAEGRSLTGSEKDDVIIKMPQKGGPLGVVGDGIVLAQFNEQTTTDSIDAGEGNNVVVDLSGEATKISTGSGNDTIVGTSKTGRYVVNSGAGDDVIELSGHNAVVNAGDGDDRITLSTYITRDVSGGNGNDVITLKGYNGIVSFANFLGYRPVIDGGDGDDSIVIGNISGSKASIVGGSGNDTISAKSGGNVSIDGNDGRDTIEFVTSGGSYTVNGGNDNDTIIFNGTGGNNKISGGDGSDEILSTLVTGGSLEVYGNDGNDHINMGSITGATSYIDGGKGNDTIEIGEISGGYHYITGGDGDDTINIGILGGHTTIDGGAGNDTITAKYMLGGTSIDGGSGNNAISTNMLDLFNDSADQSRGIPDANPPSNSATYKAPTKARSTTANEISEYERLSAEAAMGITPQSSAAEISADFDQSALRPLSAVLAEHGIAELPTTSIDEDYAKALQEIRRRRVMNTPDFIEQSKKDSSEPVALRPQKVLHRYGQQNAAYAKGDLATL